MYKDDENRYNGYPKGNSISESEKILRIENHKKWLNGNPKGTRAVFSKETLINLDFQDLDLRSANFDRAYMRDCKFNNCNLDSASFFGSTLIYLDFNEASLINSCFIGARLRNCNLSNANLTSSNLEQSFFINCKTKSCCFDDCRMMPIIGGMNMGFTNGMLEIDNQIKTIEEWDEFFAQSIFDNSVKTKAKYEAHKLYLKLTQEK